MSALLIIIGIIVVGVMALAGMYNGLVSSKIKCEAAESDIDTHLKKRHDLVPNLVETVKGITKHESETFEKVVKARNAAMAGGNIATKSANENALSGTLKSLFALSEAYPDLKSNQNFLELQDDLQKIEEDLNMSRRYFNGSVKEFNTKVQQFPTNLLANMFGFASKEFFELDSEEEAKNVKVSF